MDTFGKIDIDECQMYFGMDYKVNDYITIHTPTVGEIIEFGEREYFSVVRLFTCIPSDMKSQLWDMGVDYEEISDYELFIMLARSAQPDQTKLLFGDFDWTKLEVGENQENHKIVMFNRETGAIIDELAYIKISSYLRKLHGIVPKVEHALNKTTKKILIDLDRQEILKNREKEYKSQLLGLVSAMMRYPGFKYKSNELKECSIYEFMDTVSGAQIYVSSTALLQGSYSGMIDTKKINKKEFNWLRSADE